MAVITTFGLKCTVAKVLNAGKKKKMFATSGILHETYAKIVEKAALNHTSILDVSRTCSFNDFFFFFFFAVWRIRRPELAMIC